MTMVSVPTTSTTLLRDLAADPQHPRWTEFVARYRPVMEAYLRERFPRVDADDAIQETLLAVVKVLPHYRYDPEKKGAFHNYLVGILRNKALTAVDETCRTMKIEERMSRTVPATVGESAHEQSYREWRESLYQVALQELMADETIQDRTKQVFVRTAVKGEPPAEVAASLGLTRNTVDKMKSRMTEYLRELVERMKGVC